MKQRIKVAGRTGNLGGRIIRDWIKRGSQVRAVVRQKTDASKVEKLRKLGAETVEVNMSNHEELKRACAGASCFVSALSGLREVIV